MMLPTLLFGTIKERMGFLPGTNLPLTRTTNTHLFRESRSDMDTENTLGFSAIISDRV